MKKIVDYKILKDDTYKLGCAQNLGTEVMDHIREGWEIYGFPFCGGDGDGTSHDVYQALIRYKEDI